MFESSNLLVLHPANLYFSCEQERLISILTEEGFIGETETSDRFLIGERFFQQIAFLGCSPDIELDPDSGKPYCYIQIPPVDAHPRFFYGKNTRKIACPHCKADIAEYSNFTRPTDTGMKFHCASCRELFDAKLVNWRKAAFLARCRIIIGNIYVAEAVPNENLLSSLSRNTGAEWKYSYLSLS